MSLKAFWAEYAEFPEEGGCSIIAHDEAEAMQWAMKTLNESSHAIRLHTQETALGEIEDHLGELNHAMQKAADAARAEEREACAALVDQLAIKASSSWHRHQEVLRDAAAAIRARSKESKP